MTRLNSQHDTDDVVDLPELLRAVWSNIWIVGLFVLCGVAFGMAFVRPPVYESNSVIEFFDPLAGTRQTSGDFVLDRLAQSRFIDAVFDEIVATGVMERMLAPFPGQKDTEAAQRDVFQQEFREIVEIVRLATGSVEIVVRHPDPELAAQLADTASRLALTRLVDEVAGWSNAWKADAAEEIGAARIARDQAFAALQSDLRAKAAADVIAARQAELARTRAAHDLLVEAFNDEARVAVVKPVARILEEARVPRLPEKSGPPSSVVFGILGLIAGGMVAALAGLFSGRIHSRATLMRLAEATLTAVQVPPKSVGGVFSVAEPGGTEIMVALRSREARVVTVLPTGAAMSPLPAAQWLCQRIGESGTTVVALGLPVPEGTVAASGAEGSVLDRLTVMQTDHGKVLFPTRRFDFSRDIDALLDALSSGPDARVILACDAAWSTTVLRAALPREPLVIALTRHGRTQRSALLALRQVAGLDVNLMLAR